MLATPSPGLDRSGRAQTGNLIAIRGRAGRDCRNLPAQKNMIVWREGGERHAGQGRHPDRRAAAGRGNPRGTECKNRWTTRCRLTQDGRANEVQQNLSKHPAPREMDWPKGAIFTVGHSTLPIERFISLLKVYGIECLADIRTVPRSRHNPQFNSDTLGAALSAVAINYVIMPALGGLRHARKDSGNTGWRNAGFRGYADYMQTQAFAAGLQALIELGATRRTAIM